MTIDKKLINDLLTIPTQTTLKLINTKKLITKIPRRQHHVIQHLIKNHIDSFDYFLDEGLSEGLAVIAPFTYMLPTKEKITIQVSNYRITCPTVDRESFSSESRTFPSECRQRSTSYMGTLYLEFVWYLNDTLIGSLEEQIGDIPIMVKSKLCNLKSMPPKGLIKHKEDAEEFGGYFIVNGNERMIRMLIASRRNYPIALSRNTLKDSFPFCSEFAVAMRCVGKGQKSVNMLLNYLTNGTVKLRIFYNSRPISVPVMLILRALVEYTDKKIYKRLVSGFVGSESAFYKNSIITMMKMLKKNSVNNQLEAIKHLGQSLKESSSNDLPCWWTDEEAGKSLLEQSVAFHLKDNEDKFNCLTIMVQKCFSLAKTGCAIESEDNPMLQEIHSAGQIYFTLLIERIELFMKGLKMCFDRHYTDLNPKKPEYAMSNDLLVKMLRLRFSTIVSPLKYLVATGNLMSISGLGLKQRVGITVTAEKINYLRFLSNFRSVHRGAFFTEMRTTACRKLYPEAWGFMCPVHTPDGTPCGLLNHLTVGCVVTCNRNDTESLIESINSMKTLSVNDADFYDPDVLAVSYYPIIVDGKLVAYVEQRNADSLLKKLRKYKVRGESIPNDIEICLIPCTNNPTQYPGIFIFTNIFRMMRPVTNLNFNSIEYIGSFEQVYMDISVRDEEIMPDRTTHSELSSTMFLSVLASLIPYPDYNQSPRNMYSCQMMKQTMGSNSHTLRYRNDTKMYQIETPQTPLVRPVIYDHYHLDDFPLGTNAIVAVMSYTGYDMEDAMVINKASVERGFTMGSVIKTLVIDLKALGNVKGKLYKFSFGFSSDFDRNMQKNQLDDQGLPYIGTRLESGVVICSYYSIDPYDAPTTKYEIYKSSEVAYVTDVKLIGSNSGSEVMQKVSITLWIPRRPFVGDKYANRHGQKGVCSFLWPQEDMPITESGMTPDILFNPHGYPSRMTIGMMLESMSGKASAMIGEPIDATPFRFSEDNSAYNNYGKMLEKAGFNYYGREKMYSGIGGGLLEADIFIGVVYYIRLRHMVSDKYQVRASGPVDQITHQPVKGRRRGGGVRFGEMERDSLLAHGTSFLLQDRLFNCSDRSIAYACTKCGSFVSVSCQVKNFSADGKNKSDAAEKGEQKKGSDGGKEGKFWQLRARDVSATYVCRLCGSEQHCRKILVPHVLTYLIAELAQVNIALKVEIGSI